MSGMWRREDERETYEEVCGSRGGRLPDDAAGLSEGRADKGAEIGTVHVDVNILEGEGRGVLEEFILYREGLLVTMQSIHWA
jgi:hypothetical protein